MLTKEQLHRRVLAWTALLAACALGGQVVLSELLASGLMGRTDILAVATPVLIWALASAAALAHGLWLVKVIREWLVVLVATLRLVLCLAGCIYTWIHFEHFLEVV